MSFSNAFISFSYVSMLCLVFEIDSIIICLFFKFSSFSTFIFCIFSSKSLISLFLDNILVLVFKLPPVKDPPGFKISPSKVTTLNL